MSEQIANKPYGIELIQRKIGSQRIKNCDVNDRKD